MPAIPGGNLVDGSKASLSGASEEVFARNVGRQYLRIQNVSTANDVWVNFGTTATTAPPAIKLTPGASLEMSAPGVVPTGAVYVIGTAGQALTAKQA